MSDNATMHGRGGPHLTVPIMLLGLVAAACSPAAPPSPSVTSGPTEMLPCERAAGSPVVTQGGRAPGATANAEAVAGLKLDLDPVADGLSSPVQIVELPGDTGLRAIVERTGTVRLLDGDRLVPEPFVDLQGAVAFTGEQGLLSVAFHPDYVGNGRVFVYYSDLQGDGVIVEYARSVDPFRTDRSSACLILRVDMPTIDHNGGKLEFGPDGYLYASFGDGGPGGDPDGVGQRLDTHLGKILRLDVDAAGPYGIPTDNPFVDDADAASEIWTVGLRNPWRYSFDPATGDLWIGDVGQGGFEEVNRQPAGVGGMNFGWNRMEGMRCYQVACEVSDYVLPVSGYTHDPDCAIVGGHIYRGSDIPDLYGWYVFGDFCSGTIRAIDAAAASTPDAGLQDPIILLDSDAVLVSFGESRSGELYVVDIAGNVSLLVEAS